MYLAHLKPNGEEEQRQCSLTKKSSTEAHACHLPATLHLPKQSDMALTSLVLGTENSALAISVTWGAPGSRQTTAEGASTAAACFCHGELGEAGGHSCRMSSMVQVGPSCAPGLGGTGICTGRIPAGATAFPSEKTLHNAAIRCSAAI